MITPSFQRLAAQELRDARSWYEVRNPHVAQRFMASVNDAIDRICAAPDSHPLELKDIRWVRVRGFPYRLIFEQGLPNRVLILAVAHVSRRPRYWRRRR